MHRPHQHPNAPAIGHAVIAGGLCLSLLVMLPLAAAPVAEGLLSLVMALPGR